MVQQPPPDLICIMRQLNGIKRLESPGTSVALLHAKTKPSFGYQELIRCKSW